MTLPPPADGLVSVGESFGVEHVFDPAQVIGFALSAGDDNPLHHDAELARQSRFGGLIVSGTQTAALMFGVTASHFSKRTSVLGLSFGIEYHLAVPADAKVMIRWSVTAVEPSGGRSGGHVVSLSGQMLLQDGTCCVSSTGRLLVGSNMSDARFR